MQDENYYKLTGVVNLFGIFPDFVYPVFERNGKYYLQRSENNVIVAFKEISENLYIKMIRLLEIDVMKYKYIKEGYSIGDESVFGLQISKYDFFFSGASNFALFIANFDTDDHILAEKIAVFLDKSDLKGIQVKGKKKILNN